MVFRTARVLARELAVAYHRRRRCGRERGAPAHAMLRRRERVGQAHRELAGARIVRIAHRLLHERQVRAARDRGAQRRERVERVERRGLHGGPVSVHGAREERPRDGMPRGIVQPRITQRVVYQSERRAEPQPVALEVAERDRGGWRHGRRGSVACLGDKRGSVGAPLTQLAGDLRAHGHTLA